MCEHEKSRVLKELSFQTGQEPEPKRIGAYHDDE